MEEDGRVEDYINDRIQTTRDLQHLDDLLHSLEEQHDVQTRQLREAEVILQSATQASQEHNKQVRQLADTFNEKQADLDKQLLVATDAQDGDDAVRELEARMERIHMLNVANGYFTLLTEVEKLGRDVPDSLGKNPRKALASYLRIRKLREALIKAQTAAEGAATHIIDSISNLVQTLRAQLTKSLGDRFKGQLSRMRWPDSELELSDESLLNEWRDTFEMLLEVQEAELSSTGRQDPAKLLPIAIMVHPLELRFKFHFYGDKPTNRLDKPEYFLSHILDLLSTYSEFFALYVQPIFDSRSARTENEIALFAYYDAVSSFITPLLSILRQKITAMLPDMAEHPQLIGHLMRELVGFDAEIRDSWNYVEDAASEDRWKGLSWEVQELYL